MYSRMQRVNCQLGNFRTEEFSERVALEAESATGYPEACITELFSRMGAITNKLRGRRASPNLGSQTVKAWLDLFDNRAGLYRVPRTTSV